MDLLVGNILENLRYVFLDNIHYPDYHVRLRARHEMILILFNSSTALLGKKCWSHFTDDECSQGPRPRNNVTIVDIWGLTLGSLLPWILNLLTQYFCEVDGIIINILQVKKKPRFMKQVT